jgi:hypothetical protein
MSSIVKKIMMRVMVSGMRIMQYLMPQVTRTFVQRYANHEIIACGLRSEDRKQVSVIFMRQSDRGEHILYKAEGGIKKRTVSEKQQDFSKGLVDQLRVSVAVVGERYVLQAPLQADTQKVFSSPFMQVKDETVRDPNLMNISTDIKGITEFSWPQASHHDPMIYFLVLEDGNGHAIMGAYTRSTKLLFPDLRSASLIIGMEGLKSLALGTEYVAKLLLVDYDGWVSHMAEKRFRCIVD